MIVSVKIAKTLTTVSLTSWLLFGLIELISPTTVMRIFSPHWFLATFLIGAIWWYHAINQS